ncbi:MAG: NUDIX domain-containing protein [Bacilli bacterium]|nr:NUDIX domain-containing protein [Bacilli bacterium]MBR4177791.1 NUDIX domain-containing protein [Bacilli bacterium]
MVKERSCGIIVFDEDDKVLLIKHNGGHISFPKGHVEKGETFKETAIRETFEETGIEAEIVSDDYYPNKYSPKENHMKTVLLFVGKKTGGNLKPQLEEVSLCDFFSYEDAMKELTYDIDRRILKQAYEVYKKIGK